MITYDASKIWSKLAGLEFAGSAKIMYTSVPAGAETTSIVKPMYQLGAKFNWP